MPDDIVTRLRDEVCECGYSASFNELHKCLRCEAADEIERLGELLFQEIYYGQEKRDEIERLRALLHRWENCELVCESLCEKDNPQSFCNACKEIV